MKKITVDTEQLNSSVSYFILASKELEEINYFIKMLGNEMFNDVDLKLCPEYSMICEELNIISRTVFKLLGMFENLVSVVATLPERYSETEKNSVNRIKSIVFETVKSVPGMPINNSFEAIDTMQENGDTESLSELIKKQLLNITLADIATSQNDVHSEE